MTKKPPVELKPFGSIFDAEEVEATENAAVNEAPLTELHAFKNTPFMVNDDDSMYELAQSIRTRGVLSPAIVRPRPAGGYEVLAGMRRKRGSELAELENIPIKVYDVDDDEAVLIMVDSNLHREKLTYKEKAFAYKMMLDALKRQGKRNDLTCGQVDHKSPGGKSVDEIAARVNKSRKQIQRYVRLTYLIPALLAMVDVEQLAFNTGVALSYLTPAEQEKLEGIMDAQKVKPSLAQATQLKELSQAQQLSNEAMRTLFVTVENEPGSKSIPIKKLRSFFPADYSPSQIEAVIFSLVEKWASSQ